MPQGVARWLTTLVLAAIVAIASDARAQTFAPAENARLQRGETIERPQTLEQGGRRYVGGVTYTVVEASTDELDGLLEDVATYKQILPHTKEATFVGRDGEDLFVELRQGNFLFEASYTIRVRKFPRERTVRFWLDRSRPHGIEDAWGFFRYQPLAQASGGVPRVLLTYGILVDIGPGIVRDLFEGRIQRVVLTVPQRVRAYVWANVRPRHPHVPASASVSASGPGSTARFP